MIVVVGDTSETLANWCKYHFGASVLLDSTNWRSTQSGQVYHTALGDLEFDQIKTVCLSAARVIYCHEVPWADQAAKHKTQQLLNHVSHFRTVENFDAPVMQQQLMGFVPTQSSGGTVWAFGCSHTAGVGLLDPQQQAFGVLVADRLGMKSKIVAQSGMSTRWSLNHILQTKFMPDDIVVWATTSAERVRRTTQGLAQDQMLSESDRAAVSYYNDNQLLYEHLEFIHTGVTYLQQKNTKFVLLTLLGNTPLLDAVETECSGYKQWCPCPDWRQFDRGTDGKHIGPIGHQHLALRIVDHVKLLDYA
jgi:hypothetical protein